MINNPKFVKIIYIILCLSLILVNFYFLILDYDASGFDYQVYYGASKAIENGKDPFYINNTSIFSGSGGPFNYLPITLPFLELIRFQYSKIFYFMLWTIFLFGTYFIVWKCDGNTFNYILFITILLTGFMATYWNYLSGNVGLIEMFIFTIAIYYLIKGHFIKSPFFLAITAIFKGLPLLFGSLYLLLEKKFTDKLKIIGTMIASYTLFSILSFILYPKITPSYYLSLFGLLPQYTSLDLQGGYNNPTPYYFFKDIVSLLLSDSPIIHISSYLLFMGFIISIYIFNLYNNKNHLENFFIGVIAIFFIFPRSCPYSFVILLVPIYYLMKKNSYVKNIIYLFIISMLPLLFRRARLLNNLNIYPFNNSIIVLISDYGLLLCLVFLFVTIILDKNNVFQRINKGKITESCLVTGAKTI